MDIEESSTAIMTIWEIINKYLNKDSARHLEDISTKWNNLYMLEDEPYCYYFSKIDSVVAVNKLKCYKIIQDAKILVSFQRGYILISPIELFCSNKIQWEFRSGTLLKSRLWILVRTVRRENIRCKDSIHQLSMAQEIKKRMLLQRANKSVSIVIRRGVNFNKKGHLRSHSPLFKTTHYGSEIRPALGMLRCVR